MLIRLVFTKERPFRGKLHATNEINRSFLVPVPYSLLSIVRLRKTNAFGEITHLQTNLELEKREFNEPGIGKTRIFGAWYCYY